MDILFLYLNKSYQQDGNNCGYSLSWFHFSTTYQQVIKVVLKTLKEFLTVFFNNANNFLTSCYFVDN